MISKDFKIGVPEREEREDGTETISEETTVDNFLYLMKGIGEAQ